MVIVVNNRNKQTHIHKQTAANMRTACSGGSHSGKNGLAAYWANVSATMACNENERQWNGVQFL